MPPVPRSISILIAQLEAAMYVQLEAAQGEKSNGSPQTRTGEKS
jgi:hypothetical protein